MSQRDPRKPLAISRGLWFCRWLQTGGKAALHRIGQLDSTVPYLADNASPTHGVSVCGKDAVWYIPGLLSRIGAPRCAACCKAVGIPRGKGAPWNSKADWRSA